MDDDTRYNGDELQNPEDAEREEEAEEESGTNSPDEALEEDADTLDENQRIPEDAGDNLNQQSPTQDQTVGEDDVGGFPDEAYDFEEETDQDDDEREA